MLLPQNLMNVFQTALSPADIHAFQDIERQHANASKERYGLIPTKNAFALKPSDVLQLAANLADVSIEKKEDKLHIGKAGESDPVILNGAAAELVDALLKKLQTPQIYTDVETACAQYGDAKIIKSVCEQLLGICIEIQQTLATLESELPLSGLLRFPLHSPYKLPRAYWENSIAVRRALPLLYETCGSKENFLEAIAGLHRLATMGESGDNIYGGAGGLPTEPGIYRQQDIKTGVARWCHQSLEWWLKFLKVPVKLVKEGPIKSIGKRAMVEISMGGLQCMHLYEADGQLVFRLLDEARDNLRDALQSAKKKNVDTLLGQLARFLQLFAVAHPFNNINASIAMNVVNDILEKQGLGRLPHLYLDYIAQRTRPTDFSLIFKAVFEKHRLTGTDKNIDALAQTNMKELVDTASNYLGAERAAFLAAKLPV